MMQPDGNGGGGDAAAMAFAAPPSGPGQAQPQQPAATATPGQLPRQRPTTQGQPPWPGQPASAATAPGVGGVGGGGPPPPAPPPHAPTARTPAPTAAQLPPHPPAQPPAQSAAPRPAAPPPTLPHPLFDAVLDLPRPGGAAPPHVVVPPDDSHGIVLPPLDLSSEIVKFARYAFPEFEDREHAAYAAARGRAKEGAGWCDANSGECTRDDGYLEDVYVPGGPGGAGGGGGGSGGGGGGGGGGSAGGGGYSPGAGYAHSHWSPGAPAAPGTSGTPGGPGAAAGPGGGGPGDRKRDEHSFRRLDSRIKEAPRFVDRDPPPRPDLRSLPSSHAFAHRLPDGATIHGHVRRYLPCHEAGGGRRDVGRRAGRALVVLTRNAGGGGRMWSAMLKTAEVLMLQRRTEGGGGTGDRGEDAGVETKGGDDGALESLRLFLHSAHREHVNLCRDVAAAAVEKAGDPQKARKPALARPRILSLPLTEVGPGHGLFGTADVVKFAVPLSFLRGGGGGSADDARVAGLSRNDILPLLRALGVPRTLRLLSALMSERRVVLTCADPSKLSAAAYGAAAMMGQGLLSPPGVFVPVLPPGLAGLLRSPSSYLIGVLVGPTPNYVDLKAVGPTIGEVAVFDLDNPTANEPYFHHIADPMRSIPDLTRRNVDDMDVASARTMSVADILYKDLTEVLKIDQKLFWQGAVQEKLGMAAARGKKAAGAAMRKGLKYLKGKGTTKSFEGTSERTEGSERSSSGGHDGEEDADEEGFEQGEGGGSLIRTVGKGNYAYEQGFTNVIAEREARVAFATFFAGLYGDLRSYLTQQAPGTPPVVDKQKFIRYRVTVGDTPGTGMFFLTGNFLRSAVFDAFVAARLREVQERRSVPEDAPLFALVANHHRKGRIDFQADNVRRSARQIVEDRDLPGRYLVDWSESVRNRALALTSAQTFNGDYRQTVVQLAEDCREGGNILVDTTMVLWTRVQEGKGLQWKKALLALQVFRHILLNGPITAVAEVIDGFASIRILKSYTEALRAQNSKLVRDVAVEIYSLAVDLPVLFARRRELMNVRRLAKDPKPSPLRKETRMLRGMNQFRNVHIALKPAGATVAPAPPAPAPVGNLLSQHATPAPSANAGVPVSAPPSGNYSNDLLSLNVAVAAPATSGPGKQQMPASAPHSGNYSSDLLALDFGASPSPQVAPTNSAESAGKREPDAFGMHDMSQAMPAASLPKATVPPSQPAQSTAQCPPSQTTSGTVAPTPPPRSQLAPKDGQQRQRQLQATNGADNTQKPPTQPQPSLSVAPHASRPVQQAQNQPKPIMNTFQPHPTPQHPPMNSFQPHPTLQHPPMNSAFSMAGGPRGTSAPTPQMQHQPPQTAMKSPIMNRPPMMSTHVGQGTNVPGNFHRPPQQQQQQQAWGGHAPFAGMPSAQNAPYGFSGPAAPGPMTGFRPPAGYPTMQHGPGAQMPQPLQGTQQTQTGPFPPTPGPTQPKP